MLLYVVLILLPATALVLAECDREGYWNLFDLADENKDRKLAFQNAFDADKNGIVTVQEIKDLAPKLAPDLVGHEQQVVDLLDQDGDGQLTLLDLILQYLKYDTNHDLFKDEVEYTREVDNYCNRSSKPDVVAKLGQIISSLIK